MNSNSKRTAAVDVAVACSSVGDGDAGDSSNDAADCSADAFRVTCQRPNIVDDPRAGSSDVNCYATTTSGPVAVDVG